MDCDKLVSLFIESREKDIQILENDKWQIFDSVSYKRTTTTKTEHRFFYNKASDNKSADSLVYIHFTDERFPFFDTTITSRPTIVQLKTSSLKNFRQINDALIKQAKLLFDTITNKAIYHYYNYKKTIVEVVEPAKNGRPIYLFWVISQLKFDNLHPKPLIKSNMMAPTVEKEVSISFKPTINHKSFPPHPCIFP